MHTPKSDPGERLHLTQGTVLTVEAFAGVDNNFNVVVLSTAPVGVGASGRVLRATTCDGESTESILALKVFSSLSRDSDSQKYSELMKREIAAVKQVSHKHILPHLGTARYGLDVILVSRFMRNGNLASFLDNLNKRNTECLRLVTQVADAVNFLHSQCGLVHGDLKCHNVLVSDDEDALLADFGLSTVVDKLDNDPTTMSDIRGCNTLRFAAPELLSEEDFFTGPDSTKVQRLRSKTPQSDVYAFGMLMLEAFSGAAPWNGCTDLQVMTNVLVYHDMPPHPGENARKAGLTEELWDLCQTCSRFKAAERPSMTTVFHQLLETQDAASRQVVLHALSHDTDEAGCNSNDPGASESQVGSLSQREMAIEAFKQALWTYIQRAGDEAVIQKLQGAQYIEERWIVPASLGPGDQSLAAWNQHLPRTRAASTKRTRTALSYALQRTRRDDYIALIPALQRTFDTAHAAWLAKSERAHEKLHNLARNHVQNVAKCEQAVEIERIKMVAAVEDASAELERITAEWDANLRGAEEALEVERRRWHGEIDRAQTGVQNARAKFGEAEDAIRIAQANVQTLQQKIEELDATIQCVESGPWTGKFALSILYPERAGVWTAKGVADAALHVALGATTSTEYALVQAAEAGLSVAHASADAAITVAEGGVRAAQVGRTGAIAAAQATLRVAETTGSGSIRVAEVALDTYIATSFGPLQAAEAALQVLDECDERITMKVSKMALELAKAAEWMCIGS